MRNATGDKRLGKVCRCMGRNDRLGVFVRVLNIVSVIGLRIARKRHGIAARLLGWLLGCLLLRCDLRGLLGHLRRLLPVEHISRTGNVAGRCNGLLIGKAVSVFWPHSWGSIPFLNALPGFPNFGDMRIVR